MMMLDLRTVSPMLKVFSHKDQQNLYSHPSIVSAKLKLEGQRVELMARSARLIRKQELEMEEALLRAKKEQLELETEIAANTAKLSIIKEYEASHTGVPQ